MREKGVGVEGEKAGEVMEETVYQAHMVIRVIAGEFYPFPAEDLIMGKAGPYV